MKETFLQKAMSALKETDDVKEDKFDVFGKYIACQLRSMNERENEYLQFQIHEMIFKTRFHQHSSLQNQLSSPTIPLRRLSSPDMLRHLNVLRDKQV